MAKKSKATEARKLNDEVDGLHRAVAQLQRRYDGFIDLDPKGFFLGLADYLKFTGDTPILKELVPVLIGFARHEDLSKFWELEKHFLTELEMVEPKVLAIAEVAEPSAGLLETLRHLRGIKDKTTATSSGYPEAWHDALADVVRFVFEHGRRELVQDFVIVDQPTGFIGAFRICSSYPEYNRALHEKARQAPRSVWGSWDALQQLNDAANRPIVVGKERTWSNLRHMFANVYAGAFDAAVEGRKEMAFKHEEFKIHVARVHHYLMEQIENALSQLSEEPKKQLPAVPEMITSILLDDAGYFDVNHGEVKFPAPHGHRRFPMMQMLWATRSERQKGNEKDRKEAMEQTLEQIARRCGYKKIETAQKQLDRIKSDLATLLLPIVLEEIGDDQYQIIVTLD